MTESAVEEENIAEWTAGVASFVLYREPGEGVAHGVRSSCASAFPATSFKLLDGEEGFVFAPFAAGDGHFPLWLLRDGDEARFALSRAAATGEVEAPAPASPRQTPDPFPSVSYRVAFKAFSDALREGRFQKLVLSRTADEPLPGGFSWAKAFLVACRRFVHSYVYLFHTPEAGYWLGATPEILLAMEHGHCHTMALAGTQHMAEGVPPTKWNDKDLREQALVAQYIADCLRRRGLAFTAHGPHVATAGDLAHLRTDFHFDLPHGESLGSLLDSLHPTPAVCGLPKEEALRFITAHEAHGRAYYSGFLGRLSPAGRTALYVNLRCMQSVGGSDSARLYAGGGLLADSALESEWLETERKLQTMRYVVARG